MDAVLTPHRSLSPRGFHLLFAFVIAMNCAIGAYFLAHGAYPVLGFLGLDILAVWLAFHMNYRAARRQERVQVAAEHIHLSRASPKGEDHWVVSPLWARVSRDDLGVRIASGRDAMRVGAFLSPKEQSDFARALDAALHRARRAPHRPSTSAIE